MRSWVVASGIIEGPEGLLLVQNRRRNGSLDWSTPGGVVEIAEGETILDGLTREVEEETGIRVTAWEGPVYGVEVEAQGLGWHLHAEIHRAVDFEGELRVNDPDGIVVDARFVATDECGSHLETCQQWVREPLHAWIEERWGEARSYRYRLDGERGGAIDVVRL